MFFEHRVNMFGPHEPCFCFLYKIDNGRRKTKKKQAKYTLDGVEIFGIEFDVVVKSASKLLIERRGCILESDNMPHQDL